MRGAHEGSAQRGRGGGRPALAAALAGAAARPKFFTLFGIHKFKFRAKNPRHTVY